MKMTKSAPATLPNDVLWGADAIAEYIERTKNQTYYLIRLGRIPAKKVGPRTLMARKSELDRALAQLGAVDGD